MGILAETFRERLSVYLDAHAPTRVLIGGLPDLLIERIAAGWASSAHLFLVTKASITTLPATVTICHADDLTAERQDAWAALVSPHESRDIQESIRSSGAGTVREVWSAGFPWNPCELPGVRWGDIRNEFINNIGLGSSRDHVADCIDKFREELRGEVDAPTRFFSALDTLTGAGIDYDAVCFELGFPQHAPGQKLRVPKDNECVLSLLDEFVETFKEDGVDSALESFRSITETRFAGDANRNPIQSALKFFANEFRHIQPADTENPIRAWRSIFANDYAKWQTLSSDVLAALIGPDSQRPTFATLDILSGRGIELFNIGESQIIVRDRNCGAPAVSAVFEFSQSLVDKSASAASNKDPWKLFARVNRQSLQLASPVPAGRGPHQFEVLLQPEGKQAMRFSVGTTTANEQAASKTISLWECCQDFP